MPAPTPRPLTDDELRQLDEANRRDESEGIDRRQHAEWMDRGGPGSGAVEPGPGSDASYGYKADTAAQDHRTGRKS